LAHVQTPDLQARENPASDRPAADAALANMLQHH
jgi:hypothetical protein